MSFRLVMLGLLLASPVFAELSHTYIIIMLIHDTPAIRFMSRDVVMNYILPNTFVSRDVVMNDVFSHDIYIRDVVMNSRRRNPFRLIGAGLSVWSFSVAGCGLAPGFAVLLMCRMYAIAYNDPINIMVLMCS
jgi:hypothetical protein